MIVAPVTYGQLSVWRTQERIPADRWHESNVPILWRLPAGTTVEALRGAMDLMVARHASLRTRFDLPALRQRVDPAAPGRLAVRAAPADPGTRAAAARAAVRELTATAVALGSEPGWRACALTDDAGLVSDLALCVHHIVADAWGVHRLKEDLLAALAGGPDAQALRTPAPQPYEQALEQHGEAGRRQREAARRYWAELVEEIPADEGPPRPDHAGRIEARLISAPARDNLMRIVERCGAGASAVLLALTVLAARALQPPGRETPTLVCANRFARWRPMVGTMNQSMPFPVPVDRPDEPFDGFARRVYERTIAAYRHGSHDVDELARWVRRHRGRPLVPDNFFNYMVDPTPVPELAAGTAPAPRTEPVRPRRTTGATLYVKVVESACYLNIDVRVDPSLVPAQRLDAVLWWYEDELARLAADGGARLDGILARCAGSG